MWGEVREDEGEEWGCGRVWRVRGSVLGCGGR